MARSPAAARPRYQDIAASLLRDIARGRYPVGRLLPTEIALCAVFSASRHTVREALRIVTEKGLLVRRRGAGSVVIAAAPPNAFTHSVGALEEWMRYPVDTFRETLDTAEIAADRKLAALLKCEPGTRWFRIRSVRRSSRISEPLGWTEIYVLPKYSDVVKRSDHGRTPVHQQVEKMFGESIDRAQLEIFASRIPAKLARPLRVAAGTPALTVVRRYTGLKSGMFEVTVTIHPENRYTYSMELRRELHAKPL